MSLYGTNPRGAAARRGRLALCALVAAMAVAAIAPASSSAALKDVVVVGNASAGTVTFLDATNNYNRLGSFNVVPDKTLRQAALWLNPITLAGYWAVVDAKGGERFVDDLALSPNGRYLYVSRGVLEDVAAFDLSNKKMIWRKNIGSFNSDHAALSPDGSKFIVSATTAADAKVFRTSDGAQLKTFPTGTYPHGNDYSTDGKTIYNGSIGITALPYSLNGLKGNKRLTLVDATTFAVKKTFEFEYGVRPAALTADEHYYYMQQSYHRGFIEFNLSTGTITRTKTSPATAAGDALFPDDLPANSMHHGLAMNGAESKLCNAGTIDNYVEIVDRATFATNYTVTGMQKPYWANTAPNGSHCLVSNSDGDFVSAIDYATGAEVTRVTVGDYPQRNRNGKFDTAYQSKLSSSAG